MPPLRNVRQADAVKALCRLGGVVRRGEKISHRKDELNALNKSSKSWLVDIDLS